MSVMESLEALIEAGKRLEEAEAERKRYIAELDKFWADCDARGKGERK